MIWGAPLHAGIGPTGRGLPQPAGPGLWVTKEDDSVTTMKQGVHTRCCLPLSCSGCLGNGEYHLGYTKKIVLLIT